MTLRPLVASVAFVVLTYGCLLHPDPQEMPGTYVAEYNFGTDSLSLKSDGTCLQEIRVKGSLEVLQASGTWNYDQDESRIDLSDVYAIQNRYSDEWDERTVTNRGGASYAVERDVFSRKLRLGPDEGHPHNKA
jgi:hypothetical protein